MFNDRGIKLTNALYWLSIAQEDWKEAERLAQIISELSKSRMTNDYS